jgi:L-ascorbate oxidase
MASSIGAVRSAGFVKTVTMLLASAAVCGLRPARAGDFLEPAVFASHNGVLDLLMIAKAKPIPSIAFAAPGSATVNPTGWVYEICRRPSSGAEECPTGSSTVADYGGARLALQKGDSLKIHFVNRLPKLDPIKVAHSGDAGGANLPLNPTNLHTHGMIVQPRAPSQSDPSFGDYVFVSVFNPANGQPVSQGAHNHGQMISGAIDYRIDIPRNHPSGLFWFHPHVHGLALNQVSSGLAGIITVGEVADYAHSDGVDRAFPGAHIRHLILKDLQVLAAGTINFDNGAASVGNGEVLNQEDPDFCAQFPGASEIRQGSCPGADNTADGGNNYAGGKWYFTVSGQQFPTIRATAPDGEVWRLTNASGSLSYHLQLIDDATKQPIVTQLMAIDGVSINLPQDTPLETQVQLAGAKFRVVPCPTIPAGIHSHPVCVRELVMMPSSRAELWVSYRDSFGHVVSPPNGASATLKMVGLTMGSGDAWPAVDLAKIEFEKSNAPFHVHSAMNLAGDALNVTQSGGIFASPTPYAKAAPLPANCKALPAGHRRRIFFGLEDLNDGDSFGLGYEEVDEHGGPVPGTQLAVTKFDPMKPTICLPLNPGQNPVHETWELVQLSTENHNFHIHQTKFRPVQSSAPAASPAALKPNPSVGFGVLEDNLPLGVATPNAAINDQIMNNQSGVCSVDQWRRGQCISPSVVLDIPFAEVGEFVYHCHILEHEDGGMMAKIQVVQSAH